MGEYRAAYYVSQDGQAETVLTLPEHASLSDSELKAEAIAEAKRADIVYEGARAPVEDGEPRVHIDDLVAGIRIGQWRG